MKRRLSVVVVLSAIWLIDVGRAAPLPAPPSVRAAQRWPTLGGPAGFAANTGQLDPRADFVARLNGATIYLTAGDALLHLARPASTSPSTTIRMTVVGGRRAAHGEPLEPLPVRVNDFRGSDPRRWRSSVPIYSRVRYASVYPGIDLIYYFDARRQLEYDFVVGPGASPGAVRLRFDGARRVRIDREGDLVVETPGGELSIHRPSIYQVDGTGRHRVEGRFVLKSRREVGFEVEAYDRRRALWIDPVFDYSTYLGGTDYDTGHAIAVDAEGNAYVTGETYSGGLPTLLAWQPDMHGFRDAFVAKFDRAGVLQYCTYLGGLSSDEGHGIAVDAQRNVYVTGSTATQFGITSFPTTPGAFQSSGSSDDVFVTKLDASGILVASTLIGGASLDEGLDIAVDREGHPYVTGTTRSTDFPTAAPLQALFRGQIDAFVTKLNPELTGLEYSTFLGGTRTDAGYSLAVDGSGRVSVVGSTSSTDFPIANAFQSSLRGPADAFVARLDASGSALLFSTYFGGSLPLFPGGNDSASEVVLDAEGNIVVGGGTDASDLPVVGAFQPHIAGPPNPINGGFKNDAFVARFSPAGGLLASTYLGGNGSDAVGGIAVDSVGNIFVSGATASTNFPTVGDHASPIADIGAYKSADGGAGWASLRVSPSLTSIAIDPSAPSTVYAGTANDGVFKSTDGGITWHQSNAGLFSLFVSRVVVDPVVPRTVYVGTTGWGVFKSTDSGASWRPMNAGIHIFNVISLTIDPVNPTTLYAGTLMRGPAVLYKSVNGGESWLPIFGYEIAAAAIDPSAPATVYAASSVFLYKSVNGGATWSETFHEPTHTAPIGTVLIDPANPATVYAGTFGRGVFKSTDRGVSWQSVSAGLPSSSVVTSLALDSSAPSALYAGTAGAGVFKSLNGGISWNAANTGVSKVAVTDVAVDPHVPATVYIAADGLEADAFVSIFDRSGGLVYSTYAGGSGSDGSTSIAVAPNGAMHITGVTTSIDWPTTPGAIQPTRPGGFSNAFVSGIACAIPLTIQNPSASPDILWPPKHQMVPVSADYTVQGCGQVQCSLSVTSSEPVDGTGDGDMAPDWNVLDARHLLLRAERSGTGNGRSYEITITCSDEAGRQVRRGISVVVPRDLR